MRRSARPANVAGIVSAAVHLGFAFCGWNDAVRSARRRLVVTPGPTRRCHKRDFRLSLDHVEVEAKLNQAYLMVVGGMRANRERQSVTVDYRHDFQAFSTSGGSDLSPASFGHRKRRVDEAFPFIQRAVVAKLVSDICQNVPQYLVAAPGLKTSMHRLVVRIALRKHMPLRSRVEDPQDRFQHSTGRNRLTPWTIVSNMLLRKVLPDTFPLLVPQPNHSPFIAFSSPIDSGFQF